MGGAGEVLRSARHGAGHCGAAARRRSALRPVPRVAGRRGQGSGDQAGAGEVAVETEREVINPFFEWKHNGRPAGNGWNRSTNNARFGTDYFNRTGTAKSNMFDNKPTETQYFYTDGDSAGASLDGRNSYEITFAPGQEPPVNGFWSMTLYNEHHFFHPERAEALLARDQEQGPEAQCRRLADALCGRGVARQGQGEQLAAGAERPFSLYIRAYWGKQPILDGSWQPPKIAKMN